MENNHLQTTPRFNFTKLLSLAWLTPALLIISILLNGPTHNDDFIFLLIAGFFLMISISFFFQKKWIRYLIGLVLLIAFILSAVVLFNESSSRHRLDFREIAMYLSSLTFMVGLFLLTFNIGIAVEFERGFKMPIDYTKALYDAQLNQRYFFKNSIDLTTSIGLILIAPSIFLLTVLFYEISKNRFDFNTTEDVFLVIFAFGFLFCGLGAFLKFKIIRYLTLILFMLIPLFALSEIRGSISYRELMLIGGLLITGIIFSVAVGAMLFHPLTTHSFENTTKSIEDYDDILDFE